MDDSEDANARLEKFRAARDILRTRHKARGARKRFEIFISPATLSRLAQTEKERASTKFEASTQKRLIRLVELEDTKSLYDQMAAHMRQDEAEKAMILKNYLGEYRYFQYASKGEINNLKYVSGRIEIFSNRNGDPMFYHWSHDYAREEPEHRGLVFHYESKLFFAATRQGVMRLGIARTFGDTRDTSCLPGLIVSVRDDPHRDPYAARFIMVHIDNKALIDQLNPENPGAEEAFLERTNATKNAWYMLLH